MAGAEGEDSKSEIIETEPPGPGDNIQDIAESRTFLALVSSRNTSIHWLDLVEYDETVGGLAQPPGMAPESPFAGMPQTPGDSPGGFAPQFYPPHAHAAAFAQQHQSAMKSQQQYFFHLQQQQQQPPPQQPPRPGHPPAHPGYPQWQSFSPMEVPTAGESAAAAAQRRGDEIASQPHAPMWPMYPYHHPMYAMMPPPPGTPGLMGHLPPHHHAQQYHSHHQIPNGRENGNRNAVGEPYTPQQTTRTPQTEEDEEDDDEQEEQEGDNNQDEEERDTKRLRTV